MRIIFSLFRKKTSAPSEKDRQAAEKSSNQSILKEARRQVKKIEELSCEIQDPKIFTHLIGFVAYYTWLMDFYEKDSKRIISTKELLLFKYIPMIYEVIISFKQKGMKSEEKDTFIQTIYKMNEKLYHTICHIKEQESLDLNVDLKTLKDLIQSDFER